MDNYTLENKTYVFTKSESTLLESYVLDSFELWTKNRYNKLKLNIKKKLIFDQLDRCGYCRNLIETDAYYEPIEHIVAKSLKPKWMFEPRNLILTCNRCNNLKCDEETLTEDYVDAEDFPTVSEAFKIFNPHFDKWSEHLKYEDEIFLVPIPETKGEETIKICKLNKFQIITNRAKDLKLGNKKPLQKTLFRLQELTNRSETSEELKTELFNAIFHFSDRVKDNPQFN